MERPYPNIDAAASKPSPSTLNVSLPTMPSVKRQKLDRDNTAAYAASQPLFQAIKNASERLPEQGIGLRTAQEITREIHVGLHVQDGTNNVEKHVRYMDSLVESWRIVTDVYCDVFAQLTLVTAEKPAEGKPAARAHEDFLKILEAAQMAQRTAKEYVLLKERPGVPHAKHLQNQSEVDVCKKPQPSSPVPATPTPSARKPLNGTKYDKSGLKILWKDGQLHVPPSDLDKEEKKEWKTIQKLAKRRQQKGKVSAIKKDHEQKLNGISNLDTHPDTSNAPPEQGNIPMPDAEFEDAEAVSAEVEARLKAKAEAKKAKKEQKKRKRESVGSFLDPDDAPEPAPAVDQQVSEKPSKKKFKNESGEASQIHGTDPTVAHRGEKRKNSVDASDAASAASKASKKWKKKKKKKD